MTLRSHSGHNLTDAFQDNPTQSPQANIRSNMAGESEATDMKAQEETTSMSPKKVCPTLCIPPLITETESSIAAVHVTMIETKTPAQWALVIEMLLLNQGNLSLGGLTIHRLILGIR